MTGVIYSYAPQVEKVALELIEEVEDHHDLDGVPILYVFRSKAAKSHGKTILGRARKVSGLNAFLIRNQPGQPLPTQEPIFVMEIAGDVWPHLKAHTRRALVDHELCHFRIEHDDESGERKLKLRPHDLEEFTGVVERHGLWQPDVADFAHVATLHQLTLDLADATAGGGPD